MMQPVVGRVLCVWLALTFADRATAAFPARGFAQGFAATRTAYSTRLPREGLYPGRSRLPSVDRTGPKRRRLLQSRLRARPARQEGRGLQGPAKIGRPGRARRRAPQGRRRPGRPAQDPRFAAVVKQAEENERKALGAAEKAADIAGVRTIENEVEGGLRYRLRISPTARKEKPQRLIVWLHPSGGSMNNVVEQLSPRLNRHGYALLVFTRKSFAGWSGDDIPKLERTLQALATIDGLDVRQPLLLGYSAGGQMAMILWRQGLERWGGLVLDAAYPIDPSVVPPSVLPPPKTDKAARQTPVLVLVGTRDGGAHRSGSRSQRRTARPASRSRWNTSREKGIRGSWEASRRNG